MSVKQITDGEILYLIETLESTMEEFLAVEETTTHVFTSGAPEMVEECYEYLYALLKYREDDDIEETLH